ncbi:MAG TPA: hypothetical protein PLV86_01840 [Candidatus Fermentibacter daniensis]|nr:hypothetical protein [Candidatus Fermentibacter daniensis]
MHEGPDGVTVLNRFEDEPAAPDGQQRKQDTPGVEPGRGGPLLRSEQKFGEIRAAFALPDLLRRTRQSSAASVWYLPLLEGFLIPGERLDLLHGLRTGRESLRASSAIPVSGVMVGIIVTGILYCLCNVHVSNTAGCGGSADRLMGRPGRPPAMKRVLLVDDNDRYASAISGDLESRGAEVVRVRSAAEGVSMIEQQGDSFDGIVTDITIETQTSGLRVLQAALRTGFEGTVATASTGLDTWIGYFVNRFLLGTVYGCRYLIPKRLIKQRERVVWIRIDR